MKSYVPLLCMLLLCVSLLAACSTKGDPIPSPTPDPTAPAATATPTEKVLPDWVKIPDSIWDSRTDATETPDITVTDEMREASVINSGNLTRLAKAMIKAANGEKVTIAYIGGSITNGSSASPQAQNCYANLTTEWWKSTFPNAEIEYINAGIGATDSYLGVHRVAEDVLAYNPDLVIVEFSVNDCNAVNKESYESLLRRILSYETEPAVVSLFLTQQNGSDYQSEHQVVAFKHQVPMVSYRNVIIPAMNEGTLTWSQLGSESDITHPTNGGHALIAHLLTSFFNDVLDQIYDLDYEEYTLPLPTTLSRYENGTMLDNTSLTATAADDFEATTLSQAPFPNGWRTTTGGSITFDITCTNIGIVFYGTLDGKSGQFDVYIDGEKSRTIDANFQGRWGSYADYAELAKFGEEGTHTITIQPAEGTTGEQFTILAFTVS